MTNYVVLDMLYNSTYIMGSLIGSYFSAYDWNNWFNDSTYTSYNYMYNQSYISRQR